MFVLAGRFLFALPPDKEELITIPGFAAGFSAVF